MPLSFSICSQSLTRDSSQLTPQLIKPAVAKAIVELTDPIRTAYAASKEWQDVALKAYPPLKKKEKKTKDKGSHYPVRPKEEAKEEATEAQ